MIRQCKLCPASFTSRIQLFRHYSLQHSHFSRVSPLPCLYTDCMCTFQTLHAPSTHLSRYHTAQLSSSAEQSLEPVLFKCSLRIFQQPFSESALIKQGHAHMSIVAIAQMCALHSIPIKVGHTKQVLHLEQLRQTIVEEVKKTEKNLALIRKMMQTTVKSCPPVNELMDLWPALKI